MCQRSSQQTILFARYRLIWTTQINLAPQNKKSTIFYFTACSQYFNLGFFWAMNVSECFGTADPHSSHVARLWQQNCFTNWGESFWMSPCKLISGDVFCLFCSCSCTQVTPVTALTRLKSDRVSATQVQPGPLSCSLCPPRYPLGPLFGPRSTT